ncbi:MAG: fumarate reductase subunit D [Acidobacteriota bacterium]|nr:fumarate reductase subunit D [Acidobacteriota bacterium]
MANRSNEPLLWALFSGGGVVAAFLIPILLFLYGLAFPLGWLQPPDYERTLNLVRHPVGRLGLFVLCFLSLFHWAHRFRFTLYDGLQIKHLNPIITLICYGGAVAGTVVAAYLLWTLP